MVSLPPPHPLSSNPAAAAFRDCCRLQGVLPLDKVVVMDAGAAVECGNPQQLASTAGSRFADMLAAQEGEGEKDQ